MPMCPWSSYPHGHYGRDRKRGRVGDLDKRGTGDIWTLTVEEYKKLSARKKLSYRLYRHPVFLFGIAPFLLFVVWFRFPKMSMKAAERNSVFITDLILLVTITGLILLIISLKTTPLI